MESIPPLKHCPKCQTTKPITEFAKCKGKRDGLQSNCDTCRHAHYQEVFSDPVKAEQRRQTARDRYHNNPKHRASMHASRYKYERNKWQTDPEYRKRKMKWRDHKIKTDPHWQAKDKQWRRTYNHARRARINNSNTRFTAAEWSELCAKYNHRCLCCGEQKRLSPDHVVPLSRGGCNSIDNIQPLCMNCNRRKCAKTIDYRPI